MPDATAIATDPALTESMIDLVIYSLTVAAGLSLVIERILEIFKHFTDFESKRGEEGSRTSQIKNNAKQAYSSLKQLKSAIKTFEKDKDLDAFVASVEPSDGSAIPQYHGEDMDQAGEDDFENHQAIKVFPLSERSATRLRQRAFLQLAAAGLGIMAAEAFDLRLLVLFFNDFETHQLVDVIVTGVVIGGGSQPIHVLIRFLTTRKIGIEKVEPTATTEKPKQEATPEVFPNKQIPFAYQGGVDKDKLESRNFRPGNPNKIVYHHTAMHHQNSFQAVVDEITKVKKWSTGYHCVIMPDGKVEFFCRWDRVGNHAYGANKESLGIAFHGNFHTKGNDQFSNNTGLFGNTSPTPEQIESGAMVIALWANLYNIPLDFEEDIVPHYLVKPTACPGSNFPHDKLQGRIKELHEQWQTGTAQQEITDFKQLPYVYV